MLRVMRSPLVFLLVSGCVSVMPPIDDTAGSTSDGSSGDESTSTATTRASTSSGGDDGSSSSSSSSGSSSSGSSSSGSSSSGSSTGREPLCGDGVVDPGEACDDGIETKLCDSDCTAVACGDARVNAAAGEECDDGNVDDADGCTATCKVTGCGDGILAMGEECDDGNKADGDGCTASCLFERWKHAGVAENVSPAELHLWDPCWSGPYIGQESIAELLAACPGDHLLFGCRKIGAPLLNVAAHAPAAAIVVDPEPTLPGGPFTVANGVDWYWSPSQGAIGFTPPGAGWCGDGTPSGMCMFTSADKFNAGGFCGAKQVIKFADATTWERVVFQAFD